MIHRPSWRVLPKRRRSPIPIDRSGCTKASAPAHWPGRYRIRGVLYAGRLKLSSPARSRSEISR
jgi:hypothetical protein